MIFTNGALKWPETLKMLYFAVCGSVYITCFRLYWPTRQQKIYSLLIDCNNFITNLKVPGELFQPKPTRLVRDPATVLKPYGFGAVSLEMLVCFNAPPPVTPNTCSVPFLVNVWIVDSEWNTMAPLWWVLASLRASLD